jgi:hypothetical protein
MKLLEIAAVEMPSAIRPGPAGTGTNHGAAAPNPAELRQLDPLCFPPKSPKGDFSPPVPQGSGGRPLKSPVPAAASRLL